jgi:uncharacterized membrane protein YgdD (TMEM256/DUF423 family)
MTRLFVLLGAVNALLAVALGAFGAHGLEGRISAHMLDVWEKAVDYHAMHALGLVLIGILAQWLGQSGALRLAGWLMLLGIVLFSGSLYALAASGLGGLGLITPFGGVSFLAAWALLAVAAWRGPADP